MVPRVVRRPDPSADTRLARHRPRGVNAHSRADRQRQDAHGVPLVSQPRDVRPGAAEGTALPRAVHLPAEGARRRHRTKPARAARRHCQPRDRGRARPPSAVGGDSDGRYAGDRAGPLSARSGRHPDHDPRVALSAPDLQRARGAAIDRHGHHRRNPRAGSDQARRPSGVVAGAAGRAAAAGIRGVRLEPDHSRHETRGVRL